MGRGVMGFLRKCGGELRKVVKMDWGGITRYIWRRITTNFRVGLGRWNNELNGFLGGEGLGRSTVAHFARKVRGTDMSRTCLKYIVDYAAPLPL